MTPGIPRQQGQDPAGMGTSAPKTPRWEHVHTCTHPVTDPHACSHAQKRVHTHLENPTHVNTHTRVHAHGRGGSLRPFHGSCCWARGTAPAFLQVPSGNSRARAALIPDFKPFSRGHGVPLNRGDSLKGSGREGTLEAAPPNAPWHPALRESCRGRGDTPSTAPGKLPTTPRPRIQHTSRARVPLSLSHAGHLPGHLPGHRRQSPRTPL